MAIGAGALARATVPRIYGTVVRVTRHPCGCGCGCEGSVFTNFVINVIYAMRNNNWVQLLFRLA